MGPDWGAGQVGQGEWGQIGDRGSKGRDRVQRQGSGAQIRGRGVGTRLGVGNGVRLGTAEWGQIGGR